MRPMGLMRLMGPMGLMRPMGLMGPMGPMGLMRLMRLMGLMGLMGPMGLMGCSGGHVVEPQIPEPQPVAGDTTQTHDPAIAFMTDLPEHQAVTRAGTPLEDYATSFRVWGFKNMSYNAEGDGYGATQTVFQGYFVNWVANTAATTASNSHDWEYVGQEKDDEHIQTIKFWDWSAKAYRFCAVAPSTAGAITNDDDKLSIMLPADATTAEAEAATPYYSHLWFSDNTDDKLYGAPVTLEFIQPFAKVRFLITYPDPPEDVSPPIIQNFDFRPEDEDTDIAVKGEVTITFPIQGSETTEKFSVEETKSLFALTRPYTVDDPYWQTVLPCMGPKASGGQGTYVLKVLVNGEEKSCTVPEHYMTWHPGYKYTYIFKVNADGLLTLDNVWVGVTTMDTEKEVEHIIYNW